jgi:hypothetical protein
VGHSIGDGIIVLAIAALTFGYFYLKYRTRKERLEIIHQERIMAMDKKIPLPELPIDPPVQYNPYSQVVPLILGLMLAAFGSGTMIALYYVLSGHPDKQRYWVLPLPVTLMGVGLILVHLLVFRRER